MISIGEILVVVLVFLILFNKPSEISGFANSLGRMFAKVRSIFLGENIIQSVKFEDQISEINEYIIKISDLGFDYEGSYEVESVKEHYLKILSQKGSKKGIVQEGKINNLLDEDTASKM
jgi:hypothetical protein